MKRGTGSRGSERRIRYSYASILLGFVLFGGGLVAALAFFSAPAAAIPEDGKLFTLDRGERIRLVAERLENEGLIRSSLAFRVLAKLERIDSSLKAGTYRVVPGMGARAILDALHSGRQALIRVTVPEGYTVSQTARLMERNGIAAAKDFLAASSDPSLLAELGIPGTSLEGYLFPDTYFLPASFGAAAVARELVSAFRTRLASIPEASGLSAAELHDRVILASIVEREYKIDEEARYIASVFLNRLRIRMALQSCATVVYVITERQGKPHPEVIYDRDLKIDDPFNTYMRRGLPPGPIASPGLTALRSIFRPASDDYLYFRLVDAEAGRHHFSQTLEEHIDARNLFIKRVGG